MVIWRFCCCNKTAVTTCAPQPHNMKLQKYKCRAGAFSMQLAVSDRQLSTHFWRIFEAGPAVNNDIVRTLREDVWSKRSVEQIRSKSRKLKSIVLTHSITAWSDLSGGPCKSCSGFVHTASCKGDGLSISVVSAHWPLLRSTYLKTSLDSGLHILLPRYAFIATLYMIHMGRRLTLTLRISMSPLTEADLETTGHTTSPQIICPVCVILSVTPFSRLSYLITAISGGAEHLKPECTRQSEKDICGEVWVREEE